MQSQKELLDSLMGAHRNLDLDDTQQRITWRDPAVCKHFLMGFCPYQLFLDTKADLGLCEKTHELYHRNNYEKEAGEKTKARYERRFIRFIRDIVNVLDIQIAREQARLDSEIDQIGTQNPDGTINTSIVQLAPDLVFSDIQKIRLEEIEQEIATKNTEMEVHGNHDRFNEAQELFREVEALEKEKIDLHNKAKVQASWATQNERVLKMCLVCGAYLDRRESQQRIDNHLEGRVHQGYFTMREKLAQLEERDSARAPKEREERHKDIIVNEESCEGKIFKKDWPDKDLDNYEKKNGSSERLSNRKKSSRRHRSRSKSRERRKKRSRSKSRERRKRRRRRSRSRERRRRRRSRSRPRGRRR